MPDPACARGPLTALRVLELAGLGPAPFAGMVLADLGADVVVVDRPPGEPWSGPTIPPRFDLLRRGRRSVVLDLGSADGARAALQLAGVADVLVEGFRPGVTERLGLGPEACWGVNPRLVYARMTGWGQTGPRSRTAGHDITYLSPTGALHAIGPRDGPPVPPLNLLGDFGGGGTFLVVGVLAALYEARSSGRGQVVDAAVVDGTSLLMTMAHGMSAAGVWEARRGSNLLDGGAPFYGVFETADGGWISVGALEDRFYAELQRLLELPAGGPSRTDPAGWPELREQLAARFRTRTRAEWTAVFEGSDACAAAVLTMDEARTDPHAEARGAFVVVDGIPQPAPAPRFDRTPGAVQGPPPRAGQHTRAVLTDWGVDGIDELLACGAAVQS